MSRGTSKEKNIQGFPVSLENLNSFSWNVGFYGDCRRGPWETHMLFYPKWLQKLSAWSMLSDLTSCPGYNFLFSHLATLSVCYVMTRHHTCAVTLQPCDNAQWVCMHKKSSSQDWRRQASPDTVVVFWGINHGGQMAVSWYSFPTLRCFPLSHSWLWSCLSWIMYFGNTLIPLKSVPPILILCWVPNPFFQQSFRHFHLNVL